MVYLSHRTVTMARKTRLLQISYHPDSSKASNELGFASLTYNPPSFDGKIRLAGVQVRSVGGMSIQLMGVGAIPILGLSRTHTPPL